MFVGLATAVAAALAQGLGVQRISMIYLAAVLVCAGWLGTPYGVIAAVAATVAFNVFFGLPRPPEFTLGTGQDIVNLAVFVSAAWVVGVYGDELRRSYEALGRLARFEPAADTLAAAARANWPRELLRLGAALGLTAAAAVLSLAVREGLGISNVSMVYLAAVVVSALALGTRFALITAVSGVIAFDVFILEPRFTLQLDSVQAAANLVVFGAVAWAVSAFGERVRYERRAVRSLFSAGRSLSATADESALRNLLCDAVSAATAGRRVVIRDEADGVWEAGSDPAGAGDPPPPPPPGETLTHERWRVRALAVNQRVYGTVAWQAPSRWLQPDLPADRTVEALADIGAAAIARARLSAEHAQMEVLSQTEALRRALLASVSHDLRTPLAGILGSATSLLDYSDRFDEQVRRDLLLNIREQAHRLDRYVANLLGMTRLEAGALSPQPRPVRLEPLVFETWETLAEGGATAPTPVVEVDETLEALADAALLRQVLVNLFENAVKFGPPDGRIEVTGRAEGEEVVLTVADHGPGAAAEDLSRLFEPFVRGAAQQEGFGLGLYIARSFMEAMDGSIRAGPRGDGLSGFEVTLRLPAARR